MNKNTIKVGVIILIAVIGGWYWYKAASTEPIPPVSEVPSQEPSSIAASIEIDPKQPKADEPTTLTFSFADSAGTTIHNLMEHHARLVHTLIISEDLGMIGHIHPEDFGKTAGDLNKRGNYPVTFTFPQGGRYIVGVDVMTAHDTLSKQFLINVTGESGAVEMQKDMRLTKCFRGYKEDGHDRYVRPVFITEAAKNCPDGYRVTLTLPHDSVRAGEEVKLSHHFEKDGKPVDDLQPYLGAAIHFAIVPASLSGVLHRHGIAAAGNIHHEEMKAEHHSDRDAKLKMESGGHHQEQKAEHDGDKDAKMKMESGGNHGGGVPDHFGPNTISESLVFPSAELYQVFSQVKHEGQIVFANFMIKVGKAFDHATAKSFDLKIDHRKLSPQLVSVNEDEGVILRVATDEPGEFHISGYEIVKKMAADGTTEVVFTADQAGRYNFEMHPSSTSHGGEHGKDEDIVIGALIVNPK